MRKPYVIPADVALAQMYGCTGGLAVHEDKPKNNHRCIDGPPTWKSREEEEIEISDKNPRTGQMCERGNDDSVKYSERFPSSRHIDIGLDERGGDSQKGKKENGERTKTRANKECSAHAATL
ncbi:hypothetical protein B0H13DRAFT_1861638 [Mycena leptocephala]|nr:hypothetical protein B0H13DRAFT_1861638 [Mycena leptocephala]